MSHSDINAPLSTYELSTNQLVALDRVIQAGKDGVPLETLSDLFPSLETCRKIFELLGVAYDGETQKLSTGNNALHLWNLSEKSRYESANPDLPWDSMELEHFIPASSELLRLKMHKAVIAGHSEWITNVSRT